MTALLKNCLMITALALAAVVAPSSGRAEADPFSHLSKKLQEERMRAEDAAAKTQQELTDLEAQKAQLTIRQNEILEANTKTLTAVKVDASAEVLDVIMNKPENFAPCKVTRGHGDNAGFFVIEGTDAKNNRLAVRFKFAGEHSLLKPVAAPFKFNEIHLVEIKQPGYSLSDENKSGPMAATLRFDETQKALHAVFTGQAVGDQWMGMGSSLYPTTLTCLLL